MPIRSNHQMPARVRIPVENNKTKLPAIHYQILSVLCARGCLTENTLRLVFLLFHVGGTPRRPQILHCGKAGTRSDTESYRRDPPWASPVTLQEEQEHAQVEQ